MKILIWTGCIFGLSIFITMLRTGGILLGGIPTALLYGGMFWLARTLCKKWDNHKKDNTVNTMRG